MLNWILCGIKLALRSWTEVVNPSEVLIMLPTQVITSHWCPCRCLSTTHPWRNRRSSSLDCRSLALKSNWRNSAKVTAPSKMFVWSRIAQESPRWGLKTRTVSRCLAKNSQPVWNDENHLSRSSGVEPVDVLTLCFSLQGLAYVEFAEEAQAAQAVQKMDGMEVDGNKISVAISNPPRRNMMDKPGSNRPTSDMMPRQVFGS